MCCISVVIPLYNKKNQILKAIESVLRQSFQDFEIIIVNDGSTDGSGQVVSSLSDNRLRLIEQPNRGVSAARNTGIDRASGDFITFLDADDEWDSEYLQTQIDLTQKYPECDIFVTNYQFRYNSGKTQPTILRDISFGGEDGVLENYFKVASCSHPPITSITILARRECWMNTGRFPLNIRSGEDLLTWAKLVSNYKMAFSKKVCATYNLGDGYEFSKLPPRRQDMNDPVGRELKQIHKAHPDIPGFKKYISHWHKMRASVALRYGERVETIKESFKSLAYNPLNFKVVPFIGLALLPHSLCNAIIRKVRN